VLVLSACVPASRGGQYVLTWGAQGTRDGQFVRPRAIGAHAGQVYVVDTTGRIQVFTRDGEFVRLWSMPKHDNGTPTCIAFARDGRVLVPDTHYSRIAEFNDAGELQTMWGRYGSAPGDFIYPTGIAESPDGRYFISEYGDGTERVQVFGPTTRFSTRGAPTAPNPANSTARWRSPCARTPLSASRTRRITGCNCSMRTERSFA
jgi:DNA-binding beta-propeller fold protein YncE